MGRETEDNARGWLLLLLKLEVGLEEADGGEEKCLGAGKREPRGPLAVGAREDNGEAGRTLRNSSIHVRDCD